MSKELKDPPDRRIDVARRRLLARAVYVPPAVLGTLALTLEGCQATSCQPSNCNPNGGPCVPNGGPCNPNP